LEGAETIFRFGVLQLRVEQQRVDRVEILHPRVIAFELYYFNILQDSVRALYTSNQSRPSSNSAMQTALA
jgi:hypothetical protein